MYLRPAVRGQGAARLLDRIEAEARRLGLEALALETGLGFKAARRSYERAVSSSAAPSPTIPTAATLPSIGRPSRFAKPTPAASRPFDVARP